MVAEKVNFEEAVKILKSLKYSDCAINCIKTRDEFELKKVMLKNGYRTGYDCWVMIGDIDSELDIA